MTTSKKVLRLLAGKGVAWMAASILFTLILSISEYGIAIVIILFLLSLNLVGPSQLPHWLPHQVQALPLWVVLALLLLIGVLRAVFQVISSQTGHALLELVRARLNLIQGYCLLILEKERSISMSRIQTLMSEHFPKASDYVFHSTRLILDILFGLAMGLGMILLAWRETLVAFLCLILVGIGIFRLNRSIARLGAHVPRQREIMNRTIIRICRNWLLIRIMRLKELEYGRFLDSVLKYYVFSRNAFIYRNLTAALPPLMGILSLVIILYISLNVFHTSPAALLGFIYLLISFTRKTVSITDRLGTLSHYRAQFLESMRLVSSLSQSELAGALEHEGSLALFRRRRPGRRGDAPAVRPAAHAPQPRAIAPPEIRIKDMTFSFPDASRPIFHNFSLTIPAGSRFAIVGPNGSGKSTLLGIILGIIRPEAGVVRVGGMDCSEYFEQSPWVGYVGEDNFLIQGSIGENLVYGLSRRVKDDDLWQVLKMVRLEKKIKSLPGGLDFFIQESGDGLSSGEKQRLALARAFLRSPSILVLDEASSNLDEATEAELAEILKDREGKCTTLIVSHKQGILKGVEHVLRLTKWEDCLENGT
jgi:ABC-type multidrug transport system fused ATPase/permease subunit